MTEDITVNGGRLTVKRPVKGDLDIDLSNVDTFHFERGAVNAPGALVIREMDSDEEHVIRVDHEDAAEIMEALMTAMPADMVHSEESTATDKTEKIGDTPTQTEAPVPSKKPQAKQGHGTNR